MTLCLYVTHLFSLEVIPANLSPLLVHIYISPPTDKWDSQRPLLKVKAVDNSQLVVDKMVD